MENNVPVDQQLFWNMLISNRWHMLALSTNTETYILKVYLRILKKQVLYILYIKQVAYRFGPRLCVEGHTLTYNC